MNKKGEGKMKKIIPFKKDIIFKTNIAEITSISLENTLSKNNDNEISGEFTVSGEYRITDESIHTESFLYNLPFDIRMDDKYDLENVIIDVDDFYYEIINNNVLNVNIDVLVDKLEEKLIIEPELEEVVIPREDILDSEINVAEKTRCIEPVEEKINEQQFISTIFDNKEDTNETYKSYKIYIVREGDDLEFIMEKYSTTKDILEQYNDLKEIKIGDKIIIPSENEFA